jgi:ABC-type transport system substrate-binding protein
MVVVLVSVAIITFVLSHVVPANPEAYMAGPGATQSQVASIQHALGLDKPLPEQFLIYKRPFTLNPTLFMTAFFQTGGLYNMSKYSNPRVDHLLTRAAQTFSQSAQARFMDQAQRIVRDQAPCVWGARPRTVDAVPDYVRGYVIDRTDYRWSMKFYLIRILAH